MGGIKKVRSEGTSGGAGARGEDPWRGLGLGLSGASPQQCSLSLAPGRKKVLEKEEGRTCYTQPHPGTSLQFANGPCFANVQTLVVQQGRAVILFCRRRN